VLALKLFQVNKKLKIKKKKKKKEKKKGCHLKSSRLRVKGWMLDQ
jgi:hypothetical protein